MRTPVPRSERWIRFFMLRKRKRSHKRMSGSFQSSLAIICINSNVISSMNARIGQEQASLDELVRQYEDVEQRIQNAIDPENVANWAQQNGMTKAD